MTNTHMLASWTDTRTRQAIVAFVDSVTAPTSAGYVPPAERIAVFDNDGTLWCEKPIPTQLDFTLRRLSQQAAADPSLADVQPYRAATSGDLHWLGAAVIRYYRGDDADMKTLMTAVQAAFGGIGVEAFVRDVAGWIESAENPVLKRPYRNTGYQPMAELLRYLEANGFVIYIASGGDRDFTRVLAEDLYAIPPERVIGSPLGLGLDDSGYVTNVLYKSKIDLFDDGPAKPIRIWSRIGRRPLVAVGNSNGDIPMLRFARSAERPGLRILIDHDDATREFAYSDGADAAIALARTHGWTVVSMKNDWSSVFAAEVTTTSALDSESASAQR